MDKYFFGEFRNFSGGEGRAIVMSGSPHLDDEDGIISLSFFTLRYEVGITLQAEKNNVPTKKFLCFASTT